jgi:hypothetical protein
VVVIDTPDASVRKRQSELNGTLDSRTLGDEVVKVGGARYRLV